MRSIKALSILRILLISLLTVSFFQSSAPADTKIANDPTRIGVGARVLGMGKSFVGLSDDLTSMYINPAGLATIDQMQLTTLSGKFINEFNYLNLGVANPTRFGNFGLGYVGSSISFTSPAATTEVVDGVRIIPSSTEGVSYDFLDSVMVLTWGKDLKGTFGWSFLDNLSAGATLKFFSLNLAGPGITQGTAAGNELDLGLRYQPNPAFRLGMVLQNALPFTMGGKIKWQNGTEESLPSLLKLGSSFKILGQEGYRTIGNHELNLNIDGDLAPTRSEIPFLWHSGLEWWPIKMLAIRAGIDQDYVGTGTGAELTATNNLTAGVGLLVGQFRFDYAFHQYNQITDNDTHYFSLSYGVGEKKPEFAGPPFDVDPADKTILFTTEVTVKGKVLDPAVKKVFVNGTEVVLTKKEFATDLFLDPGKNSLILSGADRGKDTVEMKVRLLSLKKFKDVAADYWAAVPISLLAMEGIISGYPDGTFRPDGNITRAEFTKLLMAAKGIGDFRPRGKPYKDIQVTHWAANYIGFGARYGYVKGYPDRTFRPNNPVTRAEGVAMISRFAKLPESKTLEMPFKDVPGRYWAIKEIIRAYEAGILEYLTGQPFEPKKPLTRAEVAEMLSKTPPLKEKVDYMLDWEQGY